MLAPRRPRARRLLAAEWDKNGDGILDKGEFRANVTAMGIEELSRKDIDALFDTYDNDGTGELSLEELKPTIKSLMEAASSHAQTLKDLARSRRLERALSSRPHRGWSVSSECAPHDTSPARVAPAQTKETASMKKAVTKKQRALATERAKEAAALKRAQ